MAVSTRWVERYSDLFDTEVMPATHSTNPPGLDEEFSTDNTESEYDIELTSPEHRL